MLNLSKSLAKKIVKQQEMAAPDLRGIHCHGDYGVITTGTWLVRFPVPNLTGVYAIEPHVITPGCMTKVSDERRWTVDHLLNAEPGPQTTDPQLLRLVLEILDTLAPSMPVSFCEYKDFLRINVSKYPDLWAVIAPKIN
jgi:hypothetical protein